MTENERIIRAFAAQFTPPLEVVETHAVDGVPAPGAWMAAYWDGERCMGVTAIANEGNIRAFIECTGKGEIAEAAGKTIAMAIGMFSEGLTSEAP